MNAKKNVSYIFFTMNIRLPVLFPWCWFKRDVKMQILNNTMHCSHSSSFEFESFFFKCVKEECLCCAAKKDRHRCQSFRGRTKEQDVMGKLGTDRLRGVIVSCYCSDCYNRKKGRKESETGIQGLNLQLWLMFSHTSKVNTCYSFRPSLPLVCFFWAGGGVCV